MEKAVDYVFTDKLSHLHNHSNMQFPVDWDSNF